MITEDQLKQFAPNASPGIIPVVTKWFNEFCDQYEVNTPLRIAAFFSQVIHESGSFKYVHEIASGEAYEGRKDLGNIYPGDGKRFKGRGYIQITGRNNYLSAGKHIFNDSKILLDNPGLLATPKYAMLSAFYFWQLHDLNKYADLKPGNKISTKHHGMVTPIEFISLIINGGFNGIEERKANYKNIYHILQIPNWKEYEFHLN